MAQFASSGNVSAFPASLRTYKVESKLVNDNNMSGIVRSVVDNDSYVQSFDTSGTGFMEVVIHGFDFKIDNFSSLITSNFSSASNVYAGIAIEPGSNLLVGQSGSGTVTKLDTGTTSSQFIGLAFDSVINSNWTYYIKVLEKTGSGSSITDWAVPDSSKTKINGILSKDVADKNTIMYCTKSSGLVAGISIFCNNVDDGLPSTSGLVDGSICFIYDHFIG